MASWALSWVLRNPAVTAVIPGCKTVEQVESNAAAADLAATQNAGFRSILKTYAWSHGL